ncbi:MAG: uracil-DNA glycosylase family protein [Flavobacteriales bacterium]
MTTLADRLLKHVLSFSLRDVPLPRGIGVLDPFNGPQADEVERIVRLFHQRYYSDDRQRVLMLGINPGRLGAGSTGLPFTDTKRCESDLGIPVEGLRTHEPSSDFFYRMIHAAGGPPAFYSTVYVHAICPLGFVKEKAAGKVINLNYYDDPLLEKAVTPFITHWLLTLIGTGMRTDVVFCVGTGKNLAFLERINTEHGFFERIVALEHPRFVMQYKAKQLDMYIAKYTHALAAALKE